jgi:apolipoprotein N-acyltransferase
MRAVTALQCSPSWLVFVAAALLPFAYAPYGVLPAAFLAYGVFFYFVFYSSSIKAAMWLGWIFGYGRFLTGLYWTGAAILVEVDIFWWMLPFAVLGLPALLAIFDALVVALWAKLRSVSAVSDAVLFGLLLAVGEYLRATILTGFPWNAPVMVWAEWPWLIQSISLLGQHALNLLILLWLVVPIALWMGRRWGAGLVVLVVSTAVVVSFGAWRLRQPAQAGEALNVTLVQPNIDQGRKWDTQERLAIVREVMDLTVEGMTEQTQMVVWPETTLPFLLDEEKFFPRLLEARLAPLPILMAGSVRRQIGPAGEIAFFNALQVWSGDGQLLDTADKHKLVPFGEFLPFQNLLEWLGFQQLTRQRGGFTAGPPNAEVTGPNGQAFGVMICYEAIFPRRYQADLRALINITNDAWFGHTAGPYQHLAQARLRAIETGLPLIRVANTGITAAFDGLGRNLGAIALGQRDTITVRLPQPQAPLTKTSPHAIFATMFIVCLVCYILSALWRKKIKI